jgi:hypothetical protein
MTSIDDINAEQQKAIDILNAQLGYAVGQRNLGVPGMDGKVQALQTQILSLEDQAYEDAETSEQMKQALATMQAGTAAMTTTAAQMTSATAFLNKFGDLIGGAQQVIKGLKGDGAAAG